jgi:uncharacterized protein YprB with RNaseH-like and TPR domain
MELHELVVKLKALAHEIGKTPTLRQFVDSGISKRQIQKHKYSEICKAAGLEVNKHSQTTEPIEPIIRPPKILFFDIETAPITAYTWGTFDQTIGLNQILEDWFVLSYAAKFKDDDRFFYLDQRFSNPIQDDFQLMCGIHHLLSEADIVVGHNSAKFDHKKLNARFIKYDLPPLSHYQVIDTLKIARKHFAFTSNKLSYLAEFLGCDMLKSDHAEFSGFSMWSECLKGNKAAFEAMEAYNKIDVEVLISVYERLAKWEPTINFQSFFYSPICVCGNKKFFKDGFKYTRQGKFQVRRCSECSKTFTAKENLIDKDLRKGFFK